MLTPDGTGFTPIVIDPQDSVIPIPEFIPLEVSHMGAVVKSCQPIYRPDISEYETKYAIDEQLIEWGVKSDYVVPLITEGVPIGTLNCGSATVDGIEDDKRQLVMLMAPKLAYSLHVARLLEQAKQSEQKYRDIYDHTLAAIFTVDLDLKITEVNQAGLQLLGYSREELLELRVPDLDIDTKNVPKLVKDVYNGFGSFSRESQFRHKSGRVVTVLNSTVSVKDLNGKIIGAQSAFLDITDRHLTANTLRIRQKLANDVMMTPELSTAIKLCTAAAIEVAGADSGGIYLIDETSGDLHLQYTEGLGEDLVRTIDHYEARSINADLVNSGKTVLVAESELDALLPSPFQHEGIRWFCMMPFRHKGKVAGCINASSHTHSVIRDGNRESLDLLSMEIGGIISRVRELEKLRMSEEKFRLLFESTREGVLISDEDGKISSANAAAAKILNYNDPADLIGTATSDHYGDPEEQPRVVDEFMKQGSFTNMEIQARCGDGKIITVLANGFLERDRTGRVLRGSFIFSDITERKQAETALRKSEELFRTIAYFNYDWEYWIDREGKFPYISPSVERITGYSPDEFMQDPELYRRIVHPEDLPLALDHRHHRSNNGSLKPILFRITHRDGSERWISHHCQPVVGGRGENLGRRGSNRDVTEQVASEQALRRSEERYSQLLELLPQAVVETNIKGEVTFINRRGYEILGFSSQDIEKNKSILDFVVPEDRESVVANMQQLFEGKMHEGVKYTGLRLDGTTFPVMVYSNVILENGEPQGVRAVIVNLCTDE